MSNSDPRSVVRNMLPSHVQYGSEGVHSRPLTEAASPRPLHEDYGAQTVGGGADLGALGSQNWPGRVEDDNEPASLEESFRRTVTALNEYAGGSLQDDKAIELFDMLVRTGLVEYMNDSIRDTAQSLVQAGYIRSQVSEAEQFRRDVGGQDAQAGTPNIQVKSGQAMPKSNSGTAPVSTVSDIGSQKAQAGPAQVPTPPSGSVTNRGHDTFPSSGGTGQNPAKIKKAAGSQKPGPNHGDDMSGGSQGIKVGNSLNQSDDPDSDDEGNYEGSRVGSVREADEQDVPGPSCPIIRDKDDDEVLYGNSQPSPQRRRQRPQRPQRPQRR